MDLGEFKKINEFSYHTKEITSVAISPDNKFILSAALDKKVFLVDVKTGHIV